MIINVFDVHDPRRFSDAAFVRTGENIMIGGMSNGVAQMVALIAARVRARGERISLLRLFGHGNEGLMGVSIGHGAKPAYSSNDRGAIAISSFADLEEDLSGLIGNFTQTAVVELFGCSVGGGRNGARLLQNLADLWGVTVRAGVLVQYSGAADTQLVFEGPVRTARPGGGRPTQSSDPRTWRQWFYYSFGI